MDSERRSWRRCWVLGGRSWRGSSGRRKWEGLARSRMAQQQREAPQRRPRAPALSEKRASRAPHVRHQALLPCRRSTSRNRWRRWPRGGRNRPCSPVCRRRKYRTAVLRRQVHRYPLQSLPLDDPPRVLRVLACLLRRVRIRAPGCRTIMRYGKLHHKSASGPRLRRLRKLVAKQWTSTRDLARRRLSLPRRFPAAAQSQFLR